jgi:hypothetical protein
MSIRPAMTIFPRASIVSAASPAMSTSSDLPAGNRHVADRIELKLKRR